MNKTILSTINAHLELIMKVQQDEHLKASIHLASQIMTTCFLNHGKILFCGNGGSAADAQHIAAELSGRFQMERPPLYAEALHVNSSFVTAVANDYNYEAVFPRMIEAAGKKGDVLVGISTSGKSKNILLSMQKAQSLGMQTIALIGGHQETIQPFSNCILSVPSHVTARIQEVHIMIGHILCDIIEKNLFGNP